MEKIEVQKISLEDAYERCRAGVPLLDVREDDEVAELAYALPEVMLMPLSELESRFSELPQNKMLITACKAGGRSLKAAQFLASKGYNQVLSMDAGMTQWQEKGFPVVVEADRSDAASQSAKPSCTCCCDSNAGGACC